MMVVVMILVLVLAPACYRTYVLLLTACLVICRRCIPAEQSAEEESHTAASQPYAMLPHGKRLAGTHASVR